MLTYIGHSGGGFGSKNLKEIREKMDPLIRKECPFKVEPQTNSRVTWLKPKLVCEVSFSGWTEDGIMRHPVFLRLREDKSVREVVRENPAENVTSGTQKPHSTHDSPKTAK